MGAPVMNEYEYTNALNQAWQHQTSHQNGLAAMQQAAHYQGGFNGGPSSLLPTQVTPHHQYKRRKLLLLKGK